MNEGSITRITIIGCEILEDEIVYLIQNHPEIDNVVVLNNEDSESITRKLRDAGTGPKITMLERIDEESMDGLGGLVVIVWIKPMALHSDPDKLRDDVISSIRSIEPYSDSVMLFYGLCGNAFKKMSQLEADFSIPILILKDPRGEIVDDCIGLVMGGSDEYLENLRKFSGTFFLTPMWADNWRKMFNKVQILEDPDDIEGAKYVFDCVGYKRVVKLDTGLGEQPKFDDQVQEFAELFEFEFDCIPGRLDIVDNTFLEAKEASKRGTEEG